MDRSKLGRRSPTQACLREICSRWPEQVQIVVDACQARLGRARIRHYLGSGHNGAFHRLQILHRRAVQRSLACAAEAFGKTGRGAKTFTPGLGDYANRSDWPIALDRHQDCASGPDEFRPMAARWEAALQEISATILPSPRHSGRVQPCRDFPPVSQERIARSPSLTLLPEPMADASDDLEDDELSVRTIWPFTVQRDGKALSPAACSKIYHALNRDVSSLLPATATLQDRRLAAQCCHIGQPVALRQTGGEAIGALRLSAGARIVSESWSADDAGRTRKTSGGKWTRSRSSSTRSSCWRRISRRSTISDPHQKILSPGISFERPGMSSDQSGPNKVNPNKAATASLRRGVAELTTLAFHGTDMEPLWDGLLQEIATDRSNTGAVMDMSIIAQLLGDKASGLALQAGALKVNRLYRVACSIARPRLRVLALAAATDLGGNTPIEFLLEEVLDIELATLYIVPGEALPDPLPEHDVAIVIAPESDETSGMLADIARLAPGWPMPLLNQPQRIAGLNRECFHELLRGIAGLDIPITARASHCGPLLPGSPKNHPASTIRLATASFR